MLEKLFKGQHGKAASKGAMLIVDDEKSAHASLGSLIRMLNYTPVSAFNLEDVSNALGPEKPIVVFLDVFIPGSNTLEILKYIKDYDNNIFIIIITGSNNINAITNYIQNGADDFFLKPFSQVMFSARMKLALMSIRRKGGAAGADASDRDETVATLQAELEETRKSLHSLQQINASESGETRESSHQIKHLQDLLATELAEKEILRQEIDRIRQLDGGASGDNEAVYALAKEVLDKITQITEQRNVFLSEFDHDMNNALLGLMTLKELLESQQGR
jgi:DNA-binding NtrC family response regulator